MKAPWLRPGFAFATVRHRTVRTKGCLSHATGTVMVFKPVTAASRTRRRLSGTNQLLKVVYDVTFRDGIEATTEAETADTTAA